MGTYIFVVVCGGGFLSICERSVALCFGIWDEALSRECYWMISMKHLRSEPSAVSVI